MATTAIPNTPSLVDPRPFIEKATAFATIVEFTTKPFEATDGNWAVVGRKSSLKALPKLPWDGADVELFKGITETLKPSVDGGSATTATQFLPKGGDLRKFSIGAVTNVACRSNAPTRPDQIVAITKKISPLSKTRNQLLAVVESIDEVIPYGLAISRAYCLWNVKNDKVGPTVAFTLADGTMVTDEKLLKRLHVTVQSAHMSGFLVDCPTSILTTSSYKQIVTQLSKTVPFELQIFEADELRQRGMNGIYSVGQAAVEPPVMLICSKKVAEGKRSADTKAMAWIGKGIVYDTGGLSLKTTEGMGRMKVDMGGSAGVFGAFVAACKLELDFDLYCILCLAENAIGPNAYRNGDIINMLSGKTVEVLNTDAEGRMVLADGIAYASKNLNPEVVVTMATLTGAQSFATGRGHAACLTNTDSMETRAVTAGKATGELVQPVLYCPEFLVKEFDSKVADLTNTVANRNNASSSAAGHFLEQHLDKDYTGAYVHFDMASVVCDTDKHGIGWGVGLLLQMFVQ